jgi:hypothetical protein
MPPILKNPKRESGRAYDREDKASWQYILTIIVGAILMYLVFQLLRSVCRQGDAGGRAGPVCGQFAGLSQHCHHRGHLLPGVILASTGGYMVSPIFMVSITLGSFQHALLRAL